MFDNYRAYVLIGIGIWAIFFGLNKSEPMPEDLMQVSGTLERAEVFDECFIRCTRYVILTIAGASGRYWTNAIRPDQFELLGGVGSNIEVYAARVPTYRPIDGNAAKSWGLTVNSRIIMRMQDSLDYQNIVWQRILPLVGGVSILIGLIMGLIGLLWRKR
jgi:hypothetical protein